MVGPRKHDGSGDKAEQRADQRAREQTAAAPADRQRDGQGLATWRGEAAPVLLLLAARGRGEVPLA
jgi:hypothetical protein